VQFENRDRQILLGGEPDPRPRGDLVQMRLEGGLDLIVVDAQTRFFRCPGRLAEKDQDA